MTRPSRRVIVFPPSTCYHRYTDAPEAIAQIAEIRGDIPLAIEMRQECLRITREEWHITEGEAVDGDLRELDRLRAKLV